jgi:3-oxoacyl-[acyl-carrier protein] reductase
MRLENKVAVVTGAASGFGEGIARRLLAEGAKVVVADINDDLGKRVVGDMGGNAAYVHADVSQRGDVEGMVQAAVDQFGKLDILVNNAGYTHRNMPMMDVPEEEFDRIFDVNVKGIFYGARAAVPVFRQQGHGGVILNVASTAGVRPRPGLVVYNASKFAAIGLTKSMAVELASDQIRVVAINPVAGETPLLEKFMGEDTPEKRAAFVATVPLGRFSKPSDIANTALFLVSDEAEFLTGVCMEVDGGRCI